MESTLDPASLSASGAFDDVASKRGEEPFCSGSTFLADAVLRCTLAFCSPIGRNAGPPQFTYGRLAD
jgi:hypothetical protein